MSGQNLPTLTIATLVCNGFPEMRETVGSLLATAGPYRFILLDNGSTDSMDEFAHSDFGPRWRKHCIDVDYIRNDENVGVVVGSQQIVEHSTTDLLAIFHNDLRIMEPGWDKQVRELFASDPQLGLVSFFGCPGVGADGRRGGLHPGAVAGWSNMVDAERHGARITEPRAIAVPDGFALILRREMLEATGGYTRDYNYDISLALASLAAGFHNMVVPVSCQHLGAQTRLKPDYMRWMSKTFGTNDQWEFFRRVDALTAGIWGPCLPLYVNEDFSFAEIDPLTGQATGRDIRGYDWRTSVDERLPVNAGV